MFLAQPMAPLDAAEMKLNPIVGPLIQNDCVDLRGVSLVYGEGDAQTLALDSATLQIRRGEFVAFVGQVVAASRA